MGDGCSLLRDGGVVVQTGGSASQLRTDTQRD